jgi:hypothetical protein
MSIMSFPFLFYFLFCLLFFLFLLFLYFPLFNFLFLPYLFPYLHRCLIYSAAPTTLAAHPPTAGCRRQCETTLCSSHAHPPQSRWRHRETTPRHQLPRRRAPSPPIRRPPLHWELPRRRASQPPAPPADMEAARSPSDISSSTSSMDEPNL